jgi:glycosyltransferase involved in cell wall biosynthesis
MVDSSPPVVLVALNLVANKRGGTEVYLEHLARTAAAADTRLVVAFADVSESVRRRLELAGARVLVFGRGSDLVAAARLARMARVERAGVALLHFFGFMSPVAPALRLAGLRVIYVDDHSGAPAHRTTAREVRAFAAHRTMMRALFRIVAVSEFVRRRQLSSGHMRDDEVVRVYNGVRNVTPLDPAARARLRAELSVPEDKLLLVAAGNLIAEKGFGVLLEALVGSGRWSVRMAGDGPERATLEELARRHALDVRFLGRRDDVPELMAASDAVVVPSTWHEAFGFTVAEAMRAGRPVVASDIGGIPELVVDGRTGLLSPPGDVSQLRARLRRLAASPVLRRRLGDAAAREARRRFGVERMAAEMFAQVKEAMHAHP